MGLAFAVSGNLPPYRRVFLIGVCVLTLFSLFETFQMYSDTFSVTSDSSLNHVSPDKPAVAGAPDKKIELPLTPQHPVETTTPVSKPPAKEKTSGTTKASRLHFVFPATSGNDLFCSVVAASLANRYPIPYVVGWGASGKFNATATHTAKLRTIKRYLETLPQGGKEDDLVFVGDGHDVMAQLPADVMIERYFQMAADADKRLADSFGISVEEARKRGLRQTLFWGADKMCWPPLHNELQCNGIPSSNLPHNVFGPKSGNGDDVYNHAKYFNSGSVIGPLGDLRKFVEAGLAKMEDTYDDKFEYKDSDQLYLQRIWAQQEFARKQMVERGLPAKEANDNEYHVSIDYESAFVQTGCHYDRWRHRLNYSTPDNSAIMTKDYFDQDPKNFRPYPIQMPANVFESLSRLFTSTPELQNSSMSTQEWVRSLKLDTNIVSKTIYSFYHATCSKAHLLEEFRKFWFHPYIEPLLKAAFGAVETGKPITTKEFDGRRWTYQTSYPKSDGMSADKLGGVFTDNKDESFIPYTTLCAKHIGILKASK